MESHRIKKVEEAYKNEIAQLLLFEAHDPLLTSVRVTHVSLTPDLRIAAVSNDYLHATKTERAQIIGRPLFEVFPDNHECCF